MSHFTGRAIPDTETVAPGANISAEIVRTSGSAENVPHNIALWAVWHAEEGQARVNLGTGESIATSVPGTEQPVSIHPGALLKPDHGIFLRPSVRGSVTLQVKGLANTEAAGLVWSHTWRIDEALATVEPPAWAKELEALTVEVDRIGKRVDAIAVHLGV